MRLIEIATSDEQIKSTYRVMKQLRPHIQESQYLQLVRMQNKQSGYQLATVKENEQILCIAGFRISHSLAWAKYLYVDDLITDDELRSRGAGKAMVDWLVEHARANECAELHLDSGVQRHAAHRFYLRERMDIVCYHFRRQLQ